MKEYRYYDFSLKLADVRRAKKVSQYELGRSAGLTPSAVAHIEQQIRTDPRLSTVLNICNALGVPLEMLCPRLEREGGKE